MFCFWVYAVSCIPNISKIQSEQNKQTLDPSAITRHTCSTSLAETKKNLCCKVQTQIILLIRTLFWEFFLKINLPSYKFLGITKLYQIFRKIAIIIKVIGFWKNSNMFQVMDQLQKSRVLQKCWKISGVDTPYNPMYLFS